jgi:hypothetical protein
LHIDDVITNQLGKFELRELSKTLYDTVSLEGFKGFKPDREELNYTPWLFEHAYARI